ncbi:unnamed protein product, partial [Ectocarpus fasciculatus]
LLATRGSRHHQQPAGFKLQWRIESETASPAFKSFPGAVGERRAGHKAHTFSANQRGRGTQTEARRDVPQSFSLNHAYGRGPAAWAACGACGGPGRRAA